MSISSPSPLLAEDDQTHIRQYAARHLVARYARQPVDLPVPDSFTCSTNAKYWSCDASESKPTESEPATQFIRTTQQVPRAGCRWIALVARLDEPSCGPRRASFHKTGNLVKGEPSTPIFGHCNEVHSGVSHDAGAALMQPQRCSCVPNEPLPWSVIIGLPIQLGILAKRWQPTAPYPPTSPPEVNANVKAHRWG
jgi:hypothetical protein